MSLNPLHGGIHKIPRANHILSPQQGTGVVPVFLPCLSNVETKFMNFPLLLVPEINKYILFLRTSVHIFL